MKFLLQRIAFTLVAAWASLTLAFVLPRLIPGDPAAVLFARARGKLSGDAIERLRQLFGLGDGTVFERYLAFLGNVLRGDLGVSISHFPSSVTEVIGGAFGWSLLLGGVAVVISFALGTGLGIFAAWRRGGLVDTSLPAILTLLGSLPYFWVAMLALYFFGYSWGLFPTRHAHADQLQPALSQAFLASVAAHAVLPAFTIVAATLGGWLLAMRNTMMTVLGEDHVTFARAQGQAPMRVVLGHAARNALLPNVTGFGMALGFVVSGALLTEIVFSYPGQGYLLMGAVAALDYPLIQGLYLTITLAVLLANLVLDFVNLALDPRLRRAS